MPGSRRANVPCSGRRQRGSCSGRGFRASCRTPSPSAPPPAPAAARPLGVAPSPGSAVRLGRGLRRLRPWAPASTPARGSRCGPERCRCSPGWARSRMRPLSLRLPARASVLVLGPGVLSCSGRWPAGGSARTLRRATAQHGPPAWGTVGRSPSVSWPPLLGIQAALTAWRPPTARSGARRRGPARPRSCQQCPRRPPTAVAE
mmetsp:Transcript_105230/g.314310  ORF Transcript_105230/g.314310 Transcript_105230/m.314310 type:complete len:203 (+) Transcript_105230:187-795(+)